MGLFKDLAEVSDTFDELKGKVGKTKAVVISIIFLILFVPAIYYFYTFVYSDDAYIEAIDNGNHERVDWMISYLFKDEDYEDSDGMRPILSATIYKRPKMLRVLLDHKAEVNVKNNNNETPLINAISTGSVKMVKMLIKAGADVDFRGPNNFTPLMVAVMFKSPEITKILLDAGAEKDDTTVTKKKQKITALLLAIHEENFKIASLLLKYNANPLIKNEEGNIALNYIDGKKHPEIYRLLKEATQKRLKENKLKAKAKI